MNPTLWYMPVIIGLYVIFLILIKILERYGPWELLCISAFVTYASIGFCFYLGYPVTHQSALFTFYIILFAFGMLIGHTIHFHSNKLYELASAKMFVLGIIFYVLSWAMTEFWDKGDAFNYIITALGIFFPTLYVSEMMYRNFPKVCSKIYAQLSHESYYMYLIHGPIIFYIANPALLNLGGLPLRPTITIAMALIYCGIVFLLAQFIHFAGYKGKSLIFMK